MFQYVALFREAIAAEVASELETSPLVTDTYQVSEMALLIHSESSPAEVAKSAIGISGERMGIVFRLDGAYQGHFYRSVWDWMKAGRDEGGP